MAKKNPKSRFFIGNIAWNKYQWQQPYIESRSQHRYISEGKGKPGHDSLNFDFNKNVDDNKYVFGYVPFSRGNPQEKRLAADNVVMFLWTKNLDARKTQIVGVYGGYKNVVPYKTTPDPRFDEGKAFFNVKSEKEYSILFPVSLDDKKYREKLKTSRLVPQSGLRYVDQEIAEAIITDELNALKESATDLVLYQRLLKIYEYITGKKYKVIDSDEDEQEKIESLPETKALSRQEIHQYLQNLDPDTPTLIPRPAGKQYKTDNKTKVMIKKLRDYKCQICGYGVPKKGGGRYVEAAHIQDKALKGPMRPHNILILCPNHHKEFDKGDRKIIEHTNDKIIFELNKKKYQIDLSLGNP